MRTLVSKTWRFDAAHQLVNHDGKCAQPHGHTYTVTVGIEGNPLPAGEGPKEGMVLDFGELDHAWGLVKDKLDHRDLNQTLAPFLPGGITTSEHIAGYLHRHFCQALQGRLAELAAAVAYVRVAETPSTFAEVRS